MLISICIPTYNRAPLLVRAIRSALAQTYRDFEIIVSDDASPDDTPSQMKQLDDPRIVYLRSDRNLGIAANTNRCLARALGDLLLVLNDDDELEPDAIERLSQPFRESMHGVAPSEVNVAWCPCKVQDADRNVKWITAAGPPVEPGIDLVAGLFNGVRGPRFCGILVRTADARVVGGYDPRHGPIPDVGNWTKIAVRRGYAVCVNEPVARYTAHNASVTGTSTALSWQQAGETIYQDLTSYCESVGDNAALRKLRSGRKNFISGLLVSILMQARGKPGWIRLAVSEMVRSPQYFLTPMMARRLVVDGHKLLKM